VSSKSDSKSSSKASSRDGSPANTLRGIPLGHLGELQVEKLCENLEVVLDDPKQLDLIALKGNDYEEFPALLFRFFFVHDKTHTLLRWALEKDINNLSPNELFRGETLATRLFYWQFFGDLGKRFLTSILATVLEQFATLDHSVEFDANRMNAATTIDPAANLKWIVQKLTEFVVRLQDSSDLCPLGLRESFMLLKDVVGSKVEDSSVFIASVLFLRLICPCLVLPEQYEILSNLNITLTEHGKRGLVLASKLLQSAANNSPWENRFGSDVVNQFVAEANPLIVQFAAKLTDIDTITLGKKVIKASVTPVTASEIKQTHAALKSFIETRILNKEQLKSEIDYQQKYQLGMKYYRSNEWKIGAYGPKTPECEYSVAQLKQPGSSVFVCKYQGRFKMKYELVKEFSRVGISEFMADDRIAAFEIIERFDENQYDMHVWLGAMFPLSPRDAVYKRRNFEETENRWVDTTYSVQRSDRPQSKKYVRMHADVVFTLVERDPSDPEYTLYTFIFDLDLKGMVPAFFVNKANKDNLTSFSKLVEGIMNLDKHPIVPVHKKEPQDKKRESSKEGTGTPTLEKKDKKDKKSSKKERN